MSEGGIAHLQYQDGLVIMIHLTPLGYGTNCICLPDLL